MITLLDSFLSQVEILLIGCLLYSLRLIISGDKRPILETLPDCVRNDLKNKYWLTFLGVLWFGFYTWLRYYLQFPRYGMWSSLFAYDNKLCWIILFFTIATRIGMWLFDRFHPSNN